MLPDLQYQLAHANICGMIDPEEFPVIYLTGSASGRSQNSTGIIDPVSRVSVPRDSLRVLVASKSLMSTSVDAIMKGVEKSRPYERKSLRLYTKRTNLLLPLTIPIPGGSILHLV